MHGCILIGNGVNLLSDDCLSWKELLRELVGYIQKDGVFSLENKPFPLLYEEITLRAMDYRGLTEEQIKKKVAQLTLNLGHNDFHRKIYNLPVSDILTTNYDFGLESTLFSVSQSDINVIGDRGKERTYRLFTHVEYQGRRIWHIHGDALNWNSIVLGHDMYSKVLNKQIEYTKKNDLHDKRIESWLDLFLQNDVYILGFSFDYNEIDLWWVLNYRARLIAEKKSVRNKIRFYTKKETNLSKNERNKIEAQKELFFAHHVDVSEIIANTYEAFYDEALDDIEFRLLDRGQ